jgi:hypothetical protein
MLATSNRVVGGGFGASCRARDQRRKIIAITAFAVADCHYRVEGVGINGKG